MVHKDFGGLTGVVKGEDVQLLKPVKIGGRKPFDYSKIEMYKDADLLKPVKVRRKPFDCSKIEKSENADGIIYGTDEICLILGIYGKYSEIYNAMAEGKVVSGMIKESIERHKQAGDLETAKREKVLLDLCLERESWKLAELNA